MGISIIEDVWLNIDDSFVIKYDDLYKMCC